MTEQNIFQNNVENIQYFHKRYCYGKMCPGCNECEGKVFHAPDGKACAIYDCTIHKKKLENCGNCPEAPCDIWMKTRDSKFSDKEFAENVKMRMEALKKDA